MVGFGALECFYSLFQRIHSMAPAEHVEGESGQVEHEAGHEDRVQGGQDPAHQVQAGGGGETLNEGITKTKTKKQKEQKKRPSPLHSSGSDPRGMLNVALMKCDH